MTSLSAFTIVAFNYLPLARVLADSFLRFHPEANFTVVVVDHPVEARLIRDQPFDVIPITEINFGESGFEDMATIYDVTEFATSVKPFALLHLLANFDCVIYLDPDIKLYSRLDQLVEATVHSGWSLTPHCLLPITRDGSSPTERDIMQSGVYNLGYVGVTRAAIDFLEWWCERLRRDAISDPSQQLFTDQRWVDLAVPIFEPQIVRSPAYNVAYWNVDQRRIWSCGETLMAGDEPLAFFHFSGYDSTSPHLLSKHQGQNPRTLLSENEVLAELCTLYGREVETYRRATDVPRFYGWGEAVPGLPLTRAIRRMFRDELIKAEGFGTEPPPSPFRPGGAARFRNWLVATPDGDPRCLPRFLGVIYEERRDLQEHFPRVMSGQLEEFERWVHNAGKYEYPAVRLLGSNWKASARKFVVDAGRSVDGVDVVGYLQAELGVGEAGRLLIKGLDAAEVTVSPIAWKMTVNRQEHDFKVVEEASHDVVILAVNADQLPLLRRDLGTSFFEGRHVIGQWFWELDEFPRELDPSFDLVDEVWVATEFMRAAVSARAPVTVPVNRVPLPIIAPPVTGGVHKEHFGLEDRFMFLFMFDFLSVLERKNPIGLVRAFKHAFRPEEGPILVLKSINGSRRLDWLERLRWECRDRNDIILFDSYLDPSEAASFMATCDCYVSLHRSEGLGLTMAEAMTLGKPVIATNYSGNVDFMNEDCSTLVPWVTTHVGGNAPPYSPKARWAEPDIEFAAAAMRDMFENPEAARQLGLRGQQHVTKNFSPAAVGALMRQRLELVRRTRNVI